MLRQTSIRARLLTAIFAGSILVIFTGASVTYALVKQYLYAEVDHFLRDKLAYQQIAAVQNGERISFRLSEPVLESLRNPEHPDFFQFRFLDGRDIYSSAGLEESLPLVGLTSEDAFKAYDCNLPHGRRGRCMGMVFIPEQFNEGGLNSNVPIRVHLVVARDRAEIDSGLMRLRQLLTLMGVVMALCSLLATTLIVRNALKPMGEISAQIESTNVSAASSKVHVHNPPSEVVPVIDRLNQLLSRVSSAIENERQFTANAAHELRNPLAGLKTQLELALSSERNAETDQDVMSRALIIQEQMEVVVSNLLMLARLDSGTDEFEIGVLDPRRTLRQCWKPYFEVAEKRDLRIRWEMNNAPESFCVAAPLFRIMFSNLFENCVSYAPIGGKVHISVEQENSSIVISIKNTNPGISESNLDQLFERFRRGDPSAAGGVGHAGIGLSLCQRITETINGQLVAAADSEWFVVTVKIPGAQI